MSSHKNIPHPWKIIEEGFDPKRVKATESIFSLGNGAMGQRANFEEQYSGETFQGNYIGGVYYPDKTKVGWWKNGYPEYFAKVLNAPNWTGIDVWINGTPLDLFLCKSVTHFRRELNMQQGIYTRTFQVEMGDETQLEITVKRFLSMDIGELGVIQYQIKSLNRDCEIVFDSFIDGGIVNQDSNWDDPFWNTTGNEIDHGFSCLHSHTLKTNFEVCTYAAVELFDTENNLIATHPEGSVSGKKIHLKHGQYLQKGKSCTLLKYGGYVNKMNYPNTPLDLRAKEIVAQAKMAGFDTLVQNQQAAWKSVWDTADIVITGDVQAQQAIRFNIFQLNQTYNGKDARLNIGPKGFTGEKYGGSTYWDTEAYCLPFYMATKAQAVARNLLKYRYDQLDKAIENAEKLGFSCGAALYPMVTMNGEECHNEWEITFEEIHRNGAIAFAIFNYVRYTGDTEYIPEMGLEVLIGIARFWAQRVNFSHDKNKYVILGVTGPNEYENNVNNNWYTNKIAQWCLTYAVAQLQRTENDYPDDFHRICEKTTLNLNEAKKWEEIAGKMYFPFDTQQGVFLQQDGFLDKTIHPARDIPPEQRPINQHWSWDRILRSPFIKQADVLQGFYFFEDDFSNENLRKHFEYYEPLTVHESSLSPCIHAVLASRLDEMEAAYAFYLRTSRLDLDDYNKEVEEGLHITSMAGTWLSIVEGFGGMRVSNGKITFNPKLPIAWEALQFKVIFRGKIHSVRVDRKGHTVHIEAR